MREPECEGDSRSVGEAEHVRNTVVIESLSAMLTVRAWEGECDEKGHLGYEELQVRKRACKALYRRLRASWDAVRLSRPGLAGLACWH